MDDKKKELTLADLKPSVAELALVTGEVKTADGTVSKVKNLYSVKEYSLYYKRLVLEKYGHEKVLSMVRASQTERVIFLSDVVYMLIDDNGKRDFPTIDDFQKAIKTTEDEREICRVANIVIGTAERSGLTPAEEAELAEEKKTKSA